jgi:hypothetical protein
MPTLKRAQKQVKREWQMSCRKGSACAARFGVSWRVPDLLLPAA